MQVSTASCISLWSYEMMLNKLSNASGLNNASEFFLSAIWLVGPMANFGPFSGG